MKSSDFEPPILVLETVGGSTSILDQCMKLVAKGGTIAVLGIFSSGPTPNLLSLLSKEITVVGSMCYDGVSSDFTVSLSILEKFGKEIFETLVTHVIAFSEENVEKAFRIANDKRGAHSLKVVIRLE
eukprot:TRINITY_DN7535_c0_g1_i3.p2 TRINITY_DN7535_c0_g1~~TRINITY_DN7535_c0_g1_i3.p2  ORF type:complete len:127 (+),score=38.44 TRINITY_DN7535_c0_g1_i3:923-1303(+)